MANDTDAGADPAARTGAEDSPPLANETVPAAATASSVSSAARAAQPSPAIDNVSNNEQQQHQQQRDQVQETAREERATSNTCATPVPEPNTADERRGRPLQLAPSTIPTMTEEDSDASDQKTATKKCGRRRQEPEMVEQLESKTATAKIQGSNNKTKASPTKPLPPRPLLSEMETVESDWNVMQVVRDRARQASSEEETNARIPSSVVTESNMLFKPPPTEPKKSNMKTSSPAATAIMSTIPNERKAATAAPTKGNECNTIASTSRADTHLSNDAKDDNWDIMTVVQDRAREALQAEEGAVQEEEAAAPMPRGMEEPQLRRGVPIAAMEATMPGAYVSVPGQALHRTADLRFSLVGANNGNATVQGTSSVLSGNIGHAIDEDEEAMNDHRHANQGEAIATLVSEESTQNLTRADYIHPEDLLARETLRQQERKQKMCRQLGILGALGLLMLVVAIIVGAVMGSKKGTPEVVISPTLKPTMAPTKFPSSAPTGSF